MKGDRAEDRLVAPPQIGWPRGIATGLLVLVVGLGVSVIGADWLIKQVLPSMGRDTGGLLVTGIFVVVVAAIAWLLRRLQGRGLV